MLAVIGTERVDRIGDVLSANIHRTSATAWLADFAPRAPLSWSATRPYELLSAWSRTERGTAAPTSFMLALQRLIAKDKSICAALPHV